MDGQPYVMQLVSSPELYEITATFSNQIVLLQYCIEYGDKECLNILLREGANVNHATMHGWTAVFPASREFKN